MRRVTLLVLLAACGPSAAGKFSGVMDGTEACEGSTALVKAPLTVELNYSSKTDFDAQLTLRAFGVDEPCTAQGTLDGLHAELDSGSFNSRLTLQTGTIDFVNGGAATRLVVEKFVGTAMTCTGTYTGFLSR